MEQLAIKAADLIETHPKRAVFVFVAWSIFCVALGSGA